MSKQKTPQPKNLRNEYWVFRSELYDRPDCKITLSQDGTQLTCDNVGGNPVQVVFVKRISMWEVRLNVNVCHDGKNAMYASGLQCDGEVIGFWEALAAKNGTSRLNERYEVLDAVKKLFDPD